MQRRSSDNADFHLQFQLVEEGMEDTSILASIATPFAVLLIPLGFGVWQLAAAAVTGFIAKENVVGTLAVVYGITNFIDTDALELIGGAGRSSHDFRTYFSSGISLPDVQPVYASLLRCNRSHEL